MALGTIVSRITGFVRLLLIAFTIGTQLDADLFNNANTLPNALYILVAGGIFNVVLVPQMVRAMKQDPDGGDAYAHRIITLGLLVLAVATVVLLIVVPAPRAPRLRPEAVHARVRAAARVGTAADVAVHAAGVLLRRVRPGRPGAQRARALRPDDVGADRQQPRRPRVTRPLPRRVRHVERHRRLQYRPGVAARPGLHGRHRGADAVLIPFLRRAGFVFRPRFDFRGVGLGHTLRLGFWTLLFILANQVAFIVVQRLGTRGTLEGAEAGVAAAGSAVYEIGFLVSQVPHGVITVSLATAVIPTLAALAADGRHERMRLELGRTLRLALAIIAPLAVAAACLGPTAADAIAYGGIRGNADVIGLTVAAFAPAMLAFTVHYLMLRGFYANEDTRTPFFVQLVIASVNVVAAFTLTQDAAPGRVAAMLALSYGLAYVIGALLSTTLLSRAIGPVLDRETIVFAARLIVACAVAAAAMLGAVAGLNRLGLGTDTSGEALGVLVVAGSLGAAVYVVTARLIGLDQLSYVVKRAAPARLRPLRGTLG